MLSGHTRHPGNCFRLFWNFTLRIITIRAARFVLEMGGHFLGLSHYVGQLTSNWLQLILATPVVLWAGWPFFQRG